MVVTDCVAPIGAHLCPNQWRLTVAPQDLSPLSISCFGVFAIEGEDAMEMIDARHVATQMADAVLSGDGRDYVGGPWSTIKSRRRKTKEGLL